MEALIELIKELGFWGLVFAAVYSFFFFLFGDLKDSPKSRERIMTWLQDDTWAVAYRRLLKRWLNILDSVLCTRDERILPKTHRARAWSLNLLSFTLIFALAYPILSLALRWMVTNSGMVGGIEVLAPEPRAWLRYGTISLIGIGVVLMLTSLRFTDFTRLLLVVVGWGAVMGVSGLSIWFDSSAVAGAFAVAFAVAVAVAFAFAGAVAGAFAVAFAVAVAVAFAFAGAVAGAFAFAVATWGIPWLGQKTGRPTLILCLWAAFALVFAWVVTPFANVPDTEIRGWLLFLSFLPLVNGLADFLSIGLTRWSLRKGVQGMLPWSWVIDLAGAVVIFFVLGGVIIAFIHSAQPGGVALLDLETLFQEIKDPATRGQYWWLMFILFSTLIPTVLHGVLAAVAFFTVYPVNWRTKIRLWLRDAPDDAIAARGGRATLALAFSLAFVVPVFVILEAWWRLPWILDTTIWVFEWFAWVINALPAPPWA